MAFPIGLVVSSGLLAIQHAILCTILLISRLINDIKIILISRIINDDDDDGITYEKNSVLTGLSFFQKARGYLPLGAIVYLD